MNKEERVENIAKNLSNLPESDKEKFAWYLLGRQEEVEKQKTM